MKGPARLWLPWTLLTAAALGWTMWRGPGTAAVDPLPPVGEVRAVTAHSFDPEAGRPSSFNVPLDRLPAIYSALQPATVDVQARDWVILGALEMTLRDGRPFRLDLYKLRPDEPGAFSAGETYERRTYYRGGSSARLVEALRAAREAASRDGTPMQPRGGPR